MQRTNYYLFDWMDFDPQLSKDESLWKAYDTTMVKAVDGDVVITVPYQKQMLQEDMQPDNSVERMSFPLLLRAYGDSILRLFTSMVGDEMKEESDMLCMAQNLKQEPLTVSFSDNLYSVYDAKGRLRAEINVQPAKKDWWSELLPEPQPTIRLTLFPDGNKEKGVELSDDHFSPPRYDALPIGFCMTEGKADRATMSF